MTRVALAPASVDSSVPNTLGSDGALAACAAALTDSGAREVELVGDSRAANSARHLGIATRRVWRHARTCSPFPARSRAGDAPMEFWGVDAAHAWEPWDADIIHAFGGPRNECDAHLARSGGQVRVYAEEDKAAWAAAGVGAHLAPVPEMSPLARALREARVSIRARLAMGAELFVCPLADHPSLIDSRQFGFLLGLMAIAKVPIAGVLPRGAAHFPTAWRHLHGLEDPCRLFETEVSTLAFLGAADIAVVPAGTGRVGANAVLLALAHAMGIRTVEWGQRAPGKLRHTPGMAGPVIDAARDMLASREGASA